MDNIKPFGSNDNLNQAATVLGVVKVKQIFPTLSVISPLPSKNRNIYPFVQSRAIFYL